MYERNYHEGFQAGTLFGIMTGVFGYLLESQLPFAERTVLERPFTPANSTPANSAELFAQKKAILLQYVSEVDYPPDSRELLDQCLHYHLLKDERFHDWIKEFKTLYEQRTNRSLEWQTGEVRVGDDLLAKAYKPGLN